MLNLTVDLGPHRRTNINNMCTRFIKFRYKSHSPEHAKTSASLIGRLCDIFTFCTPNKEQYKFIDGWRSKVASFTNIILCRLLFENYLTFWRQNARDSLNAKVVPSLNAKVVSKCFIYQLWNSCRTQMMTDVYNKEILEVCEAMPSAKPYSLTLYLTLLRPITPTLRIAYGFISNLWKLRQRVDSLAQW